MFRSGDEPSARPIDSATAGYNLEWSPDRRNLMFGGTVRGRSGTFLLSALGGEPKWLTSGVAYKAIGTQLDIRITVGRSS